MRRLMAALALTGALAGSLGGCESRYYDGRSPSPPPPAPPLPRRPPVDACGAASLDYLVGRPVSEVPQNYNSRRSQRVIGKRSYYEDRYDAERLTILYDEDTGRITRVRCG